jgi:hypothetical protein
MCKSFFLTAVTVGTGVSRLYCKCEIIELPIDRHLKFVNLQYITLGCLDLGSIDLPSCCNQNIGEAESNFDEKNVEKLFN